jgi:hypothetical protein
MFNRIAVFHLLPPHAVQTAKVSMRSAKAFFNSSNNPFLPKTSLPSAPAKSSSNTSLLIATAGSSRLLHYGPAHKILIVPGAHFVMPIRYQTFRLSSEDFREPIERFPERIALREIGEIAMTAMWISARARPMIASGAIVCLPMRRRFTLPPES